MKSTYQSRYKGQSRSVDTQLVGDSRKIHGRGLDIYSLIESQLSHVAGSTRIRSGSIRDLDLAVALMKTTKFSRVYTSVMTTTRTYSAPTTNFTEVSEYRESEFSFNLSDITPINDRGGERVSYSETRISKEQRWTLNDPINPLHESQSEENRRNGARDAEIDMLERCIEHACGEEVSSETVTERSTTPKNFRVATNSLKSFEGSKVHE
jgi:hypothetical protein